MRMIEMFGPENAFFSNDRKLIIDFCRAIVVIQNKFRQRQHQLLLDQSENVDEVPKLTIENMDPLFLEIPKLKPSVEVAKIKNTIVDKLQNSLLGKFSQSPTRRARKEPIIAE